MYNLYGDDIRWERGLAVWRKQCNCEDGVRTTTTNSAALLTADGLACKEHCGCACPAVLEVRGSTSCHVSCLSVINSRLLSANTYAVMLGAAAATSTIREACTCHLLRSHLITSQRPTSQLTAASPCSYIQVHVHQRCNRHNLEPGCIQ